mmetsp:Transcript_22237/g.50754  ORF Transcript_22237/g.50754 Transcript_22237/m.50754 type:complete len:401 (-) Transcript_22237:142-1344(-)
MSMMSQVEFQPFSEEDYAEEMERAKEAERMLLVHVADLMHLNKVLSEDLYAEVSKATPRLDQLEEDSANAAEAVTRANSLLLRASENASSSQRLQTFLISPALVLVVIVPAGIVAGPVAAATVGIAGASAALGKAVLSEVQQKNLQQLKLQLAGTSLQPISARDAERLEMQGMQAMDSMLAAFRDEPSWTRHHFSIAGALKQKPVFRRKSRIRDGGYGYKTHFTIPLPAAAAFDEIERLRAEACIDPGCSMVWPRPVSPTTSLRYFLFASNPLKNREFHCVCRAARIATTDQRGERFGYVVQSLSEALQRLSPVDSDDELHMREAKVGYIKWCGIVVSDDGTEGCSSLIEVIADLDPVLRGPSVATDMAADTAVRHHIVKTASSLEHKLLEHIAAKTQSQ